MFWKHFQIYYANDSFLSWANEIVNQNSNYCIKLLLKSSMHELTTWRFASMLLMTAWSSRSRHEKKSVFSLGFPYLTEASYFLHFFA